MNQKKEVSKRENLFRIRNKVQYARTYIDSTINECILSIQQETELKEIWKKLGKIRDQIIEELNQEMKDLNEEIKKLYKYLLIDYSGFVEFSTPKGIVLFPKITARANAWICGQCQKTPYQDPLNTKYEMSGDPLKDAEAYDLECIYPENPDQDTIPFEMFFRDEKGRITFSVTLCTKCAEELDLIKAIGKNTRKYNLSGES